ncbi:MAG: phosphate ABC transporter ATP-binding protein PstB [Eubacteriaceae bacterium]|nr:phosphate ABC transporter ATP-binding protein PstB [Eubacteriaceae bacterium]
MSNDSIQTATEIKLKMNKVDLHYGAFKALSNVSMDIQRNSITAFIGPSGCGKSSLLRIFNRMNDLIPIARVDGEVFLDDLSIYDKSTDVTYLRTKIGMVFQKPNVFPTSIYDNLVIGPKKHGIKHKIDLDDIVERCLDQVALWGETKDILQKPAQSLTPGDQQRLCIARALAIEPDVILMDESCSALDPVSTAKVEELMMELQEKYTIIIVTHNMEQALRVSDYCAFMMINPERAGELVEYSLTVDMFSNPTDQRTEDYITGRFG